MDLIMYTLRSISYIVVEPSLIIMLILLGIVFFMKNKRLAVMQKMIVGESINSPLELTLSQIVLGIIAGVVTSIIFSCLGIVFPENSGIQLLFIVSVLLNFIKPRFICFSYSGAILGFISIIFTYFNIKTSSGAELFRFDIMSLIMFIAVLHIVEGILIMIDGDRGAIPVFSNRNGKIVGGYALKRSWIIPIALFIGYTSASIGSGTSESIATPEWWPLLSNNNILDMVKNLILVSIPMFGMIGYSSVTFTRSKRNKVLSSGIFTLAYGAILMLVAQLANLGVAMQIVALIMTPLGHELMLFSQRVIEEKREALFVSDEGIAVLEVVPYSKAFDLGIRAGDRILQLNDKLIESEEEIYSSIKDSMNRFSLKIKDAKGLIKDITVRNEKDRNFGMILVPRMVEIDKVISLENTDFSEVLRKVKENKDNDKRGD